MFGRRRAERIDPRVWLIAALAGPLIAASVIWLALQQRSPNRKDVRSPLDTTVANAAQPVVPAADQPRFSVPTPVAAAQLPWESPTSGNPLEIPGGLPGAQMILRLRLSELHKCPEFQRTLSLLGEPLAAGIRAVEQSWGLQPHDIEELTLLAAPREEQRLDWKAQVVLYPGISQPATWLPTRVVGNRGSDTVSKVYQIPSANGYRSTQLAARVVSAPKSAKLALIIAPQRLMRPEPDDRSQAVLLRRDLEQLRQLSDKARQLTLMTTTSFLKAHPEWFATQLEFDTLTRTVLRDTTALMLSAHWSQDEFYLELVSTTPLEQQSKLVDRFWEAVSNWSDSQQSIRSGWPDEIGTGPFGQRWPAMVELFSENLRIERLGDVTLVNASLPAHASHNLVCGVLLSSRFPSSLQAARQVPSTLAWPTLLATTLTYGFEQRPLDDAIAGLESLIRDTVPGAETVEFVVDGSALERAGVTRNQQIRDFQANEMALANVLEKLARLSQPGTPSVPSGRLVWAYAAKNQEKHKVLTLTTADRAGRSADLTVVQPIR